MAHVVSYSHITDATIPAHVWDEAWFSISSWKGYVQSFPGFIGIHLAARALDNGDVRLRTAVNWEYPEQLEEWLESGWSAQALLSNLRTPAYDISEDTFEDFS
jgi:hypothetical protein